MQDGRQRLKRAADTDGDWTTGAWGGAFNVMKFWPVNLSSQPDGRLLFDCHVQMRVVEDIYLSI